MAKPLSNTADLARHAARNDGAASRPIARFHADKVEITALAVDWNACAARALTPVGTHLHPWLAAAFKHLRKSRRVRLLSLCRGHILGGGALVEQFTWRWGFPCRAAGVWQHALAFEGTPLIGEAGASQSIDTLLASHGGAVLLLDAIAANGPFWDVLQERALALGAPIAVLESRERAALRPKATYTEWFDGNFDRKRRKEYRRLRARLGEQGTLEHVQWTPDMPVQSWLDDLAVLEVRGWKGERGTALRQNAAVMAALGEALPALGAQGSLRFWKIALDGRPIAMMFAIASGSKAWLGKIAYDESFAKYSPGVLLILDATESLIGEGRFDVIDSCAIPGHPMIDNIWRDRITLVDVIVGRPLGSRHVFGMVVAAERMRRSLRVWAKTLFYSVTRRRQS
ncbi:hypothetical protein BH10PSE7_BH10PSE7_44440 [soil metagenome]